MARNKYDKAANQTGGGSNKTKKPTELQYKVLQVIGKTATHGVDGADDLDTSRQQVQSALAIVQPVNDIVQRWRPIRPKTIRPKKGPFDRKPIDRKKVQSTERNDVNSR